MRPSQARPVAAWPADVSCDRLIERVFQARTVNGSHRARLRVEIRRLRAALRPLARIEATRRGFALTPVPSAANLIWYLDIVQEKFSVTSPKLKRLTDSFRFPKEYHG